MHGFIDAKQQIFYINHLISGIWYENRGNKDKQYKTFVIDDDELCKNVICLEWLHPFKSISSLMKVKCERPRGGVVLYFSVHFILWFPWTLYFFYVFMFIRSTMLLIMLSLFSLYTLHDLILLCMILTQHHYISPLNLSVKYVCALQFPSCLFYSEQKLSGEASLHRPPQGIPEVSVCLILTSIFLALCFYSLCFFLGWKRCSSCWPVLNQEGKFHYTAGQTLSDWPTGESVVWAGTCWRSPELNLEREYELNIN